MPDDRPLKAHYESVQNALAERDKALAEVLRLRGIIGGLYVDRGGSREDLYVLIKRAFRDRDRSPAPKTTKPNNDALRADRLDSRLADAVLLLKEINGYDHWLSPITTARLDEFLERIDAVGGSTT